MSASRSAGGSLPWWSFSRRDAAASRGRISWRSPCRSPTPSTWSTCCGRGEGAASTSSWDHRRLHLIAPRHELRGPVGDRPALHVAVEPADPCMGAAHAVGAVNAAGAGSNGVGAGHGIGTCSETGGGHWIGAGRAIGSGHAVGRAAPQHAVGSRPHAGLGNRVECHFQVHQAEVWRQRSCQPLGAIGDAIDAFQARASARATRVGVRPGGDRSGHTLARKHTHRCLGDARANLPRATRADLGQRPGRHPRMTLTLGWTFSFAFFSVMFLWCLNAVACELENPFGDDANDINAHDCQEAINRQLLLLLRPGSRCIPRRGDGIDAPRSQSRCRRHCQTRCQHRCDRRRQSATIGTRSRSASQRGHLVGVDVAVRIATEGLRLRF